MGLFNFKDMIYGFKASPGTCVKKYLKKYKVPVLCVIKLTLGNSKFTERRQGEKAALSKNDFFLYTLV